VAVIDAEPAATEVTSPFAATVAMAVFELLQAIVRPLRTLPLASRSTALAWVDWPAVTDAEAKVTLTEATGAGLGAVTVIAEVPL